MRYPIILSLSIGLLLLAGSVGMSIRAWVNAGLIFRVGVLFLLLGMLLLCIRLAQKWGRLK